MEPNLDAIIMDGKVYVVDKNIAGYPCRQCELEGLCDAFKEQTEMPLCYSFQLHGREWELCFKYSKEMTEKLFPRKYQPELRISVFNGKRRKQP